MKLLGTRGLRAPFVVTTAALVVACGGDSFGESSGGSSGSGGTAGSGGSSGSAGSAGSGGTSGSAGSGGTSGSAGSSGTAGSAGSSGSAGSGGTGGSPNCPPTPPADYELCPEGINEAGGCRYDVACQSGTYEFILECTDWGGWAVREQACSNPHDFCPGTKIACYGDTWGIWGGTNPPPPCPELAPEPGSACTPSGWGYATCGYPCEDGSGWTVGSCEYYLDPIWVFDGACAGDCSPAEGKLLKAISEAKACEQDADCQTVMTSGCSIRAEHCSGAFYVNQSADLAELEALNEAHVACLGSRCNTCLAMPPAPACISGLCAPGG